MLEKQLYKQEDLKNVTRDQMAGGQGQVAARFAFTRDEAPDDWAIREIGWMTLKPGVSIGLHKHASNEDAYIVVSGEGIVTDNEGRETPVKPGDVAIARKGQQHAIKNSGTEDLVFVGIIGQK